MDAMIESAVRDKILEEIDRKSDEMIQFLRDLVRVPSITGTSEEGRVQQVVERKLREIRGLEIDVWEPDIGELEKYPFHPSRVGEWSYRDRPNVVGVLSGSGNGSSLVLNGHIDVVSPEPLANWTHDPWSGEIERGKLYGRGSVDMKGGVAAMIYAVLCLREAGVELRGDVVIESVVEEEIGGGGTIGTLLRGYRADAAIVTEPTGSQAVCVGAGGSRFFKIKIPGKSAVAFKEHLGVNAIGLATKIYRCLLELDTERKSSLEGRHPMFEKKNVKSLMSTGKPTSITLAILRAGDWPTTVAGWAEIEGRFGFPPSETLEEATRKFEEAIQEVAENDPWMKEHPPEVQWWGPNKAAYELSPDEPLIKKIVHHAEDVTQARCEIFASPNNSDANFLATRADGYGGIPCVMYGPGGGNAHAADEYVSIDEVVHACKVLALTILDWCGH